MCNWNPCLHVICLNGCFYTHEFVTKQSRQRWQSLSLRVVGHAIDTRLMSLMSSSENPNKHQRRVWRRSFIRCLIYACTIGKTSRCRGKSALRDQHDKGVVKQASFTSAIARLRHRPQWDILLTDRCPRLCQVRAIDNVWMNELTVTSSEGRL